MLPNIYSYLGNRGPVYPVDKNHHFTKEQTLAYPQKNLVGPVLGLPERDSKFVPESKKVEGALATTGPVYRGVEAKNKVREK